MTDSKTRDRQRRNPSFLALFCQELPPLGRTAFSKAPFKNINTIRKDTSSGHANSLGVYHNLGRCRRFEFATEAVPIHAGVHVHRSRLCLRDRRGLLFSSWIGPAVPPTRSWQYLAPKIQGKPLGKHTCCGSICCNTPIPSVLHVDTRFREEVPHQDRVVGFLVYTANSWSSGHRDVAHLLVWLPVRRSTRREPWRKGAYRGAGANTPCGAWVSGSSIRNHSFLLEGQRMRPLQGIT